MYFPLAVFTLSMVVLSSIMFFGERLHGNDALKARFVRQLHSTKAVRQHRSNSDPAAMKKFLKQISSDAARRTLSAAVLSAILHGKVDERAMKEAVDAGLDPSSVLQAVQNAHEEIIVQDNGNPKRLIDELMTKLEQTGGDEAFVPHYEPRQDWHFTPAQHQAISRAIMSITRSPTREVDPTLLETALMLGLTKEDIYREYVRSAEGSN